MKNHTRQLLNLTHAGWKTASGRGLNKPAAALLCHVLAAALLLGSALPAAAETEGDLSGLDAAIEELDQLEISFEDSAGESFSIFETQITSLSGSYLRLDGEIMSPYVGNALQNTLDAGFALSGASDTDQLESRAISDPLAITWQSHSLPVRLVNPYEKAAPLKDCILASVTCEEAGIEYGMFDSVILGETTREEFSEELLASAYQDDGDTLLFKTAPTYVLRNVDMSHPYGEQLLTDEDNSMDLQLAFSPEGTVETITMIAPAYLYNGLEDNVTAEAAQTMNAEQMQSAVSLRDDILGQLSQAFAEAGVDVHIDQQKGTIRMANEVLFDLNAYELSAEGQAYLDSFIGVYASVLLGGSFADQIESIEIAGHTDTNGTWEDNQILSENRAKAVYDYCLGSTSNGMDDTQKAAFTDLVSVKGCSYSDPVFTDQGEIDADASRRVEIRFFIRV